MTTFRKYAGKLGIGLGAAVLLMGVPSLTVAEEINIYDPAETPFRYTECYSATDPMHPGPAAHFGEDVCVDYEATSSEVVQFNPNDLGTTDVHWALFQNGTASVHAQVDGVLLYDGPFRMEEIAQDLEDDADCVWTTFKGGDDQHTWTGACSELGSLDFLTYKLELYGETPFIYEAFVSGPGIWCAFDSGGQL